MITTPSILHRLQSLVYEGILLFGLYFAAAFVFLFVTQEKNIGYSPLLPWFSFYLFVVFGLYFVYCWVRSGQTLAMKTWHLKIQNRHGQNLTIGQAISRYVLAYSWFLPSIAIGLALGKTAALTILVSAIPSILLWSCTALLHRERQFLHDRLAHTRIVKTNP